MFITLSGSASNIVLFPFLGPHLAYGRSWLGVKSELQLPVYTTAAAMPDPSLVCSVPCSSQQCQILNPLSEARNPIRTLMDSSQVLNLLTTTGSPWQVISISEMEGFETGV